MLQGKHQTETKTSIHVVAMLSIRFPFGFRDLKRRRRLRLQELDLLKTKYSTRLSQRYFGGKT